MKRVFFWLATLLLCAALSITAGCDNSVTVNDEDDGGTVTLSAGQTLKVVLESNATTGYSWRAGAVPACLEQQGESAYDSKGSPGVVGAGGEETWLFTAVGTGEGRLVLEYARPWESDEIAPTETFEVNVVVE
jgi:inhibitor of cysteine peptidase